jgi:hypothetical protein
MGDVGKGFEQGVAGIGNFMGLGGEQELGGGGEFAMSYTAKQGEEEAIQRLRNQASGTGPSITELRYKQAMDDMIKQQQSAAASARGVSNQALLNRNVALGAQEAQLGMAREVSAQKLAEQRGADAGLIQAAAAQRGVALDSSKSEAQLAEAASKRRSDFIGNLAGSAGAAAASDENLKTEIKKGSATDKVEEFLSALKSYDYKYKEESANGRKNPEGEVTSVMAQDLEKSDLGKQMVKDGPDGKEVDYGQGLAAMLAGIAELNERTKKLEKKV